MNRTSLIIRCLTGLLLLGLSYHSSSAIAAKSIDSTTHIALQEERTKQWQKAVYNSPESAALLSRLAPSLYRLGVYYGDLYKVSQAIGYISRAIRLEENQSTNKVSPIPKTRSTTTTTLQQLYLSRAAMHMTLHEFAQASADIERAKILGVDESHLWLLRGEIHWNKGEYQQAQQLIEKAATQTPSVRNLTRLAVLHYKLGNSSIAQQFFQQAEKYVEATHPVQTAWLRVQQGIVHLEHERFAQAEVFFQQAVNFAPNYILALEHLAETLASQGKVKAAIDHYDTVLSIYRAPQFVAALAEVHQEQGNTQQAEALMLEAKQEFDTLMAFFPQAMSGHAADFYLEYEQQAKELSLLKSN